MSRIATLPSVSSARPRREAATEVAVPAVAALETA